MTPTFDLSAVIIHLVNTGLPTFTSPIGNRRQGLLFTVEMSASVYAPSREDMVKSIAAVHVLVERPTNYTKVWIAQTPIHHFSHCAPEKISSKAWSLRSDHDSCWRDDGIDSPMSIIADKLHASVLRRLSAQERLNMDRSIRVTSRFPLFGAEHAIQRVTFEIEGQDRDRKPVRIASAQTV